MIMAQLSAAASPKRTARRAIEVKYLIPIILAYEKRYEKCMRHFPRFSFWNTDVFVIQDRVDWKVIRNKHTMNFLLSRLRPWASAVSVVPL